MSAALRKPRRGLWNVPAKIRKKLPPPRRPRPVDLPSWDRHLPPPLVGAKAAAILAILMDGGDIERAGPGRVRISLTCSNDMLDLLAAWSAEWDEAEWDELEDQGDDDTAADDGPCDVDEVTGETRPLVGGSERGAGPMPRMFIPAEIGKA